MQLVRSTKEKEIKRDWHLIDAKGKVLGRLATGIALLLMGKNKPYFVRNLDCGDYVVVINCQDIKLSGNKINKKNYRYHSGYPGGFKEESWENLITIKPEKMVSLAIKGMLPNNKLRDRMMTRLKLFKDDKHTFNDRFNS